ncbi:ribosome-inactivating family protein [Streptomyces yunnanensis]|nr:ribosome-inactivating family protein [Streptomyces yunnanensis]
MDSATVTNRAANHPSYSTVHWVDTHDSNRYLAMLQQLRTAVGHSFRNNVQETTHDRNQLVALNVTRDLGEGGDGRQHQVESVTIYFNASNMYFLGWSSDDTGRLYQLNGTNLGRRLAWSGEHQPITLPFGESYTALQRAAGWESRGAMEITANSIDSSVQTLHDGVNLNNRNGVRDTARAVLRMVTITSEAVRFNPIGTGVANAFLTGTPYRLTPLQQELETNWGRLSDFVHDVSQHAHAAPVQIGPASRNGNDTQAVRIETFEQAAKYTGLIIYQAHVNSHDGL